MATAKYRIFDLKSDRLIYITDVGQFPHFKLIFEAARLMGWHVPPKTSMEHMGFGLVLGPDGKKFKTRSGGTVKLNSLLDEAKDRALAQIKQRVEEQAQGKEFQTGTELF
jgi:arginyl-tRNA synthetase